jgi:hypothetical protein
MEFDGTNSKDKRKEAREQLVGDIVWSDASDTNEKDGVLIEESESGMSILTREAVAVGRLLRICCKGSWMEDRYVVVKWCDKVADDTYRCGVSAIKHY